MSNNSGFHCFAINGKSPLKPTANTKDARRFLRTLDRLGPCYAHQIVEATGLSSGTVSGKLNKLRGWGFIQGGGGKIGKRKGSGVPWQLTESGRAAIGK